MSMKLKKTWQYNDFKNTFKTIKKNNTLKVNEVVNELGIKLIGEGKYKGYSYTVTRDDILKDKLETIHINFEENNKYVSLVFKGFQGYLMECIYFFTFCNSEKEENCSNLQYTFYKNKKIKNMHKKEISALFNKISDNFSDLPRLTIKRDSERIFLKLFENKYENIYAKSCGVSGMPSNTYLAYLHLTFLKQVVPLKYLLYSSNHINKVYAAEALLLLNSNGNFLNEKDIKEIDSLRKSQKIIEVCNGCEYQKATIENVLKYLGKKPEKVLLREWNDCKKNGWLDWAINLER
jgi:hypothetical protein